MQAHPMWEACHPAASWPDALTDPRCTASAWHLMTAEAALTLEIIVCGPGPLAFSEEQLLQAARPGIAGATLRFGLLRLTEAGIVFAVRKGWGEKLFMLPLDSFFPWHSTIMEIHRNRDAVCTLQAVDPLTIDAIEESGYVPPFSLQLLHAMAQLEDAGMKFTSKGVLTKRTIAKGAEQLYLEDRTLTELLTPAAAPAAGNAEAAGAYPPALLFVLETAVENGWLRVKDGAFALQNDSWQEWLGEWPIRREGQLFRQLLSVVCARNTAAAACAASLCSLEAGVWYRLEEIEAGGMERQKLLAKPHASTIDAWCRLFRQLGWIENGVDQQGKAVVKWLLDARAESRMTEFRASEPVMAESNTARQREHAENADQAEAFGSGAVQLTPDGDLYVDMSCSYRDRWKLELIAARRRTDHTTVYRMDAGSIKRAGGARWTSDSIVAYLERLTQDPLPDPVRAAIKQGMNGYDDYSDPKSVVSIQPAKRSYETVPLDVYYEPALGGTYELLHDRMSEKHLFAGMEEVPSMWLKQFRSYHLSTRRDMMEQALSWRTTVKLNCEGAVTLFVPERIVDEADGMWAVCGHAQPKPETEPLTAVKLYPGMWEEMMLVLPVPPVNS